MRGRLKDPHPPHGFAVGPLHLPLRSAVDGLWCSSVLKKLAMTRHSRHERMRDTVPSLPAAWAAASAEIVERMEDPILPELLVRALGILTAFEYCVVFVYRGRANPIHVYDTFVSPSEKAGLINYVKN